MARRGAAGTSDLVFRTYDRLRRLIVWGSLAPGSRIIETDLAKRLGVSRTPIRSALHRLLQEGYVVGSDEGRNARLSVAPLTVEDGRQVLSILGLLEGQAAAWAAGLPDRTRLSLVADLRELNDRIERLSEVEAPDPDELFRTHSNFHQLPLELVDAPRLTALHDAIAPQAERYRRVYIASTSSAAFADEVKEHLAIIDAVQHANPEGAQLAVQRNWQRAADRLARVIESVGERGSW